MTILNQNHTKNNEDETSSTKYAEENVWELMESLQYNQSKYEDKNILITLLIFIIFLLGIVSSIGVFRWYTKNKLFL